MAGSEATLMISVLSLVPLPDDRSLVKDVKYKKGVASVRLTSAQHNLMNHRFGASKAT